MNAELQDAGPGSAPAAAQGIPDLSQKQLIHRGLVLHFMMQLSITEDADVLLAGRGMGRVHHRILYFAHFSPGISVGELLDVLGVRHQNIQRPLRELVQEGYILQRPCPTDARVKQLSCSRKGEKLLEVVSGGQRQRIARAYSRVTRQDVESFFKVTTAMLDADRRDWVDRLTRLDDPTESV